MIKILDEIIREAIAGRKMTVSVAAAHDEEVMEAIYTAYTVGLADAILVGDEGKIRELMTKYKIPSEVKIIDVPDEKEAAFVAVDQILQGKAQVLMKGKINSSDYLRAALNKEHGLRTGNILSLFVANEVPGEKKLVFITDGGVNVKPTIEEKKKILVNAIEALHMIGIDEPKVAVLAANEKVNPKDSTSVECKTLADMGEAGELPSCIIEGPIALDVAFSVEAAEHKGIESKIAGDVDLYMVPDIVVGNVFGKSLVNYANAINCGVVLGASHPMVLTSRSESAKSKLCSIALACLIASNREKLNK